MKKIFSLVALITIVLSSFPLQVVAAPLTKHPTNSRYFTDGTGKAIYLTGSHTWNNMHDDENADVFDFNDYLDLMDEKNHNFIRGWWARETAMPWRRTGPGDARDGEPRYDFNQFNQSFFDQIRQRVIAAGNRGIYVSVPFFYDGHRDSGDWDGNPWLPGNNVNNINGDPNGDGFPIESTLLHNSQIVTIQKAYVRKMIDTLNDLDNVLWEIMNEQDVGREEGRAFQYEMIRYVREYEAGKPKRHVIGMTFINPRGTNSDLFNSDADWVSPGHEPEIWFDDPSSDNHGKVVISDTDHFASTSHDPTWVWRTFLRGHNPIVMDWFNGSQWNDIRSAMGHTLTMANKMNLAAMTPQGNLSSTGYVLAKPGSEYLIYQPDDDSFDVDLQAGTYQVEWMNADSGAIQSAGSITVSTGERSFDPPFNASVLYLKGPGGGTTTPPPAPPPMGDNCSDISSSTTLPQGFGSPMNFFTNPATRTINAFCDNDDVTAQIAKPTSIPYHYTYIRGYQWKAATAQWSPITYACDQGLISAAWCPGTATSDLDPDDPSFIAYTCSYINNTWKCGCRDQTCSQNLWQVQRFAQ